MIYAHKLLANQQEDGDSPIQSIAKGLCESSRKGITEGLRNFVKVDDHCTLEVGHLREGTRSFEVRRPQCEEGSPEVLIREGPEEVTLRAEEVGTPKSCLNFDHTAHERWRPLLVDADWHAFCQAIYKGIEGDDWEELYEHYKEMSKAAGVKKPNENQKAKALCKMKAAKDRGEDIHDPDRKDILGRNKTRLELWECFFGRRSL